MNQIQLMLKARGHSKPEAYEMSAEEAKLQKELQDVLVALAFLDTSQGLTDMQNNLMITVSGEIGRLRATG